MNNYKLLSGALCLLALLLIPVAGSSQGIPSFMSGTFSNGGVSLTFSAGDAVSGSFSNSNFSLSGGSSGVTNVVPTALESESPDLPRQFRLTQNYPNPFNPSTTITYELPRSADVKIEIYNTIGARVALFDEGRRYTGVHKVQFDASSLASGLYLYRLIADGALISTKKMTLIK